MNFKTLYAINNVILYRPRRRGAAPYPINSVRIPHYYRRDLLKKQMAYQQFRHVDDYITKPSDPNEFPIVNDDKTASTQPVSGTSVTEVEKPEEVYIATTSHIQNAPKQFKRDTRTYENGQEVNDVIQTTKPGTAAPA